MNKGFCSDLHWWCTFLSEWNGVSLLHTLRTPDMVVQTDASGSWGCAAFFSGEWLQWQWTSEWAPVAIMAKELVPIILSCAVWGPQMSRKSVLFQCDNTGVVAAIKKGSSKEDRVMQLLCALWFFVAHFDISIASEHIAGAQNTAANQLSWSDMQLSFLSNPQASWLPTPFLMELLQIVSVSSPDWTSPAFTQLFSTIIKRFSWFDSEVLSSMSKALPSLLQ